MSEAPVWPDGEDGRRRLTLLDPAVGPESYLRYVHAMSPELGVRSMLSDAKGKIGPRIAVRCFNLPPLETCCKPVDGQAIASSVCRAVCYFQMICRRRPRVALRAEQNLRIAKRPDFPELLVGAIRRAKITALKIHVVGDFFEVAYIDAWSRIVELLPNVRYWTYTRAWRVPHFVPALEQLATHDNVAVNLSYDRSTGVPPAIPGTRLAWLAADDEDLPPTSGVVAFRASVERTKVPLRRMAGTPVCPHQSGVDSDPPPCIGCNFACLPH